MRRLIQRLRRQHDLVVVDTSFLMDMRALPTMEAKLIDQWVMSNGVAEELELHIAHGDEVKRQRALNAQSLLENLMSSGHAVFVKDIGDNGVDESLASVAKSRRLPLLSLDYEMRRNARAQGVQLYPLRKINRLSLPLHLGSRLRVTITDKGRRKHQGVAEHQLGTIFVSNAAEIGAEVNIQIDRISFKGVSVLLFASRVN